MAAHETRLGGYAQLGPDAAVAARQPPTFGGMDGDWERGKFVLLQSGKLLASAFKLF